MDLFLAHWVRPSLKLATPCGDEPPDRDGEDAAPADEEEEGVCGRGRLEGACQDERQCLDHQEERREDEEV